MKTLQGHLGKVGRLEPEGDARGDHILHCPSGGLRGLPARMRRDSIGADDVADPSPPPVPSLLAMAQKLTPRIDSHPNHGRTLEQTKAFSMFPECSSCDNSFGTIRLRGEREPNRTQEQPFTFHAGGRHNSRLEYNCRHPLLGCKLRLPRSIKTRKKTANLPPKRE